MTTNRLLAHVMRHHGIEAGRLASDLADKVETGGAAEVPGKDGVTLRIHARWDTRGIHVRKLILEKGVEYFITGDRHELVMLNDDRYPATILTGMAGRCLDDVCRHPALLGGDFTAVSVEQLAAGGICILLEHPEGMGTTIP